MNAWVRLLTMLGEAWARYEAARKKRRFEEDVNEIRENPRDFLRDNFTPGVRVSTADSSAVSGDTPPAERDTDV